MKEEIRKVTVDYMRLLRSFLYDGVLVKEDYEKIVKEFEKLVL